MAAEKNIRKGIEDKIPQKFEPDLLIIALGFCLILVIYLILR